MHLQKYYYIYMGEKKRINLKIDFFLSQSIAIMDNYETLPLTVWVLLKSANHERLKVKTLYGNSCWFIALKTMVI